MKYFVLAVAAAIASNNFASAFTTSSSSSSTIATTPTPTISTTTPTTLFNVPPPAGDDTAGVMEHCSKLPPPGSFFQLQQDCLEATQRAISDGERLIEVEFPPLPANVLELDDVSAYDVAQANLQLAVEFARGLVNSHSNNNNNNNSNGVDAAGGDAATTTTTKNTIRKVSILLPDEDEKSIAIERFTGKNTDQVNEDTYRVANGVTVSSLRRSEEGDDRFIKPEQTFLNLFGMGDDSSKTRSNAVKPIDGTDLYIVLVASAQELPDVEALADQVPDVPIVFYNLKLDILRGDLGAPAFPPKSFQDRFLSRVKPVYYLRTRQYSRSTPTPPFLVNYQGCIFRSYPGRYQTLLDTGTGNYRRLLASAVRPGLGEFKEQLTEALRDEGVLPETEGGALDFLRVGYKTTTWWEDERPEASAEWKT